MFAKRFFYICAGLLCLALAYHIGASRAVAQAGGIQVLGIDASTGSFAGIAERTGPVFCSRPGTFLGQRPPIPGTSPVMAVSGDVVNSLHAALANGDLYSWGTGTGEWQFRGNIFGGTTPVQPSTWGSIKARWR